MARTVPEKLIDKLLLLYLASDTLNHIRFLVETKLQKLVFLSELSMFKKEEKGFNYTFVRLNYGPFSQELRSDLGQLIGQEILMERGLRPTEEAAFILEDFQGIFERNKGYIEKIERVTEKYSRIPTEKLVHRVHAMHHPYLRPRRTIGSLKPTTPIIYRMSVERASKIFEVTAGELSDLELCFDKKISGYLEQAMMDVKTKPFRSHQEVFGTL
jgi:uncharacterized protein YwgA